MFALDRQMFVFFFEMSLLFFASLLYISKKYHLIDQINKILTNLIRKKTHFFCQTITFIIHFIRLRFIEVYTSFHFVCFYILLTHTTANKSYACATQQKTNENTQVIFAMTFSSENSKWKIIRVTK